MIKGRETSSGYLAAKEDNSFMYHVVPCKDYEKVKSVIPFGTELPPFNTQFF